MSIRKVYARYSDEELVDRYRRGDEDAGEVLAARYRRMVRALAARIQIPGMEAADREQVGWLGFWSAVEQYKASEGDGTRNLSALAAIRIRSYLINALVWETRDKRKLVNVALSLDVPRYDDDGDPEMDYLSDGFDLEREMCDREYCRQFLVELKRRLKPFEWTVFVEVLRGQSENEIAKRHRRSMLVVHAALWNARQAARQLMKEMNQSD